MLEHKQFKNMEFTWSNWYCYVCKSVENKLDEQTVVFIIEEGVMRVLSTEAGNQNSRRQLDSRVIICPHNLITKKIPRASSL